MILDTQYLFYPYRAGTHREVLWGEELREVPTGGTQNTIVNLGRV